MEDDDRLIFGGCNERLELNSTAPAKFSQDYPSKLLSLVEFSRPARLSFVSKYISSGATGVTCLVSQDCSDVEVEGWSFSEWVSLAPLVLSPWPRIPFISHCRCDREAVLIERFHLDVGRCVCAYIMCPFPVLISVEPWSDLPLFLPFRPIRDCERPGMSSELTRIIEYGRDV